MKIRLNITAWVLGLFTIVAVGCNKEDVRPNIVFILADDDYQKSLLLGVAS